MAADAGRLTLAEGREGSAAMAAAGVAVLGAARVLPGLWAQGINPVPPCPFRLLTGHPCPFCGATRSFCAMARGDVLAAAHFHPLGPLLFVAVIALTVAAAVVALRGGALALRLSPAARQGLVAGGLALLAVSWTLKWFWLGP
ncbi:MAG TPA: DUF2752 domain-containing protein [Candidatus Dormibacteraeota bacterium]|nr:DUF2752 domain-containing protein [Candidatus Dormibacteraeota bacterium]